MFHNKAPFVCCKFLCYVCDSGPAIRTASVAQLVEHLFREWSVIGSNPTCRKVGSSRLCSIRRLPLCAVNPHRIAHVVYSNIVFYTAIIRHYVSLYSCATT